MVTISIAKAGLRKALRQPLFYILLGLFGVMVFLAQFFIIFTFGEETTMLREVGLASILMCGLILSVFLSAESISAEEESRTLSMLLACPVKRSQIVIGKFVGSISATFIALSALTALFLTVLALKEETLGEGIFVSVIAAYAQSALVAALAILFSTFLPFAANVVVCCALFLVGNILPELLLSGDWNKIVSAAVISVLPNFSNFNFTKEIALRIPVPLSSLFWALLYAGAYITASLSLAVLILRTREFK